MDHNKILHSLPDFLDGSLRSEDRTAVEEHLKICSSCAAEFRELRKTIEHVRSLSLVRPPAWMTQKIMIRVREVAEKKKETAWSWLFRGFRFPAQALSVVFLTVTVFLIYRNLHRGDWLSERTPTLPQTPAPITVPKSTTAKNAVAPPTSAGSQTPADRAQDSNSPSPAVSYIAPTQSRQAAPSAKVESASDQPALARAPQANEVGAVTSTDQGTLISEAAGKILLIRIRTRGSESLARIEDAIRETGGTVVRRDGSPDGWIMTLQINQSKHTALLNALRRVGKPVERILAIDGQEGREILMQNGPKAAAGC